MANAQPPFDWPAAVPLRGRAIVLEPLDAEGLAELAPRLHTPSTFAGGWGGGPAAFPDGTDEMVAFLRHYLPPTGRPGVGYLVRALEASGDGRRTAGEVLGTTSFLHLDPAGRSVEIGCTALVGPAAASAVNTDMKLAMHDHAFASGAGRVVFNADARNTRSLAALQAIGATREGLLRRHRPRADGTWRDTVTHSIVVEEWPRVRARLVLRLDAKLASEPR